MSNPRVAPLTAFDDPSFIVSYQVVNDNLEMFYFYYHKTLTVINHPGGEVSKVIDYFITSVNFNGNY